MYPDTRGRISTDSTGSSRPVNSSHSLTSFSTTITTLTGNGGTPLFAGDLLQSTTIRDTAANAATVSSLFTMVRIVRLYIKECEQLLAHFFVFQNRWRRDCRLALSYSLFSSQKWKVDWKTCARFAMLVKYRL